MPEPTRSTDEVSDGETVHRANTTSGVAAGAAAGAVLGSMFFPGLGGLVGSLIGAVVMGGIAAKHDADAAGQAAD